MPAEDLKQEGFLGFLRAVELYNPKMAAFLTYAQYWIKMAMYDYAYRSAYMINIPNEHHVIASKCRKLCAETSELPTSAQLAKALNISETKIKKSLQSVRALRNYTPLDSVDKFISGDELALPKRQRIFELAKEVLTPQEYFILQGLYGSDDQPPHTLAWVGEIIGVSKERIRQIKNIALKKLREFFERNPQYAAQFKAAE